MLALKVPTLPWKSKNTSLEVDLGLIPIELSSTSLLLFIHFIFIKAAYILSFTNNQFCSGTGLNPSMLFQAKMGHQ